VSPGLPVQPERLVKESAWRGIGKCRKVGKEPRAGAAGERAGMFDGGARV